MSAPATKPPQIDLSDVQGEILQPYDFAVGTHLFLHVADPARGRRWLRSLVDGVTTAAQWGDGAETSLNIGFSYPGLFALTLNEEDLVSFPYEFRVGMAERGPILGDTGASAPDQWDKPLGDRNVHVWLMVQAATEALCTGRVEGILTSAAAAGVQLMYRQDTANFTGEHARAKEHFGFMDGIGEPQVEGSPATPRPGQGTPVPGHPHEWDPIALGSFLLGYPNAFGGEVKLPKSETLRKNGTYLVFRKLEQHVERFREHLTKYAALFDGDEELVAAKMVGRWRSGAPIALSPYKDDPKLAEDPEKNNDFRYADDPEGLKTPHLAHIRRANPRDSFPKDSVVKVSQHRIIRRSMPYGPWLPEHGGDRHEPRGLVFRVYNSMIRDQFELVQAEWIGSANENGGLSTDQDVIAGLTEPIGEHANRLQSTLPIPTETGMKTLYELPRFVTLKGGDYFFVPGIAALRLLATDPPPKGS